MTSTSDFRLAQEAQKRARKAGWQLVAHNDAFLLVPLRGMSNRLLALAWGTRYKTLEEAVAFCDGWHLLERNLQRKAGMGANELSDRMEQHRVLTALKGKGRGKRDDGI